MKASCTIKESKAAGVISIALDFLKKGGDCVGDWLIRIFIVYIWIMVMCMRISRMHI